MVLSMCTRLLILGIALQQVLSRVVGVAHQVVRLGPAEAHEARHIPYNTAQQRECVSASACACACVRDKAAEEIPLLRLMSPKGQTGQRERTV